MAIEDFELWLRLSLEGFKFKYIDKNLGYLLERKQSESKIKINKIHGYKLILNKYKKYLPNKTYKRANIYQKYLFANILFLSKKQKSFNFFKFSLIKSEFFPSLTGLVHISGVSNSYKNIQLLDSHRSIIDD